MFEWFVVYTSPDGVSEDKVFGDPAERDWFADHLRQCGYQVRTGGFELQGGQVVRSF